VEPFYRYNKATVPVRDLYLGLETPLRTVNQYRLEIVVKYETDYSFVPTFNEPFVLNGAILYPEK
jgi:hypothetical protein